MPIQQQRVRKKLYRIPEATAITALGLTSVVPGGWSFDGENLNAIEPPLPPTADDPQPPWESVLQESVKTDWASVVDQFNFPSDMMLYQNMVVYTEDVLGTIYLVFDLHTVELV